MIPRYRHAARYHHGGATVVDADVFELVLTDMRGLPIDPHKTRDALQIIGKTEKEFADFIGDDIYEAGYAYGILRHMVNTLGRI